MTKETKGAAWKRLRDSRLWKLKKTLETIGYLSNPYNYEYTLKDVEALFEDIQRTIDSVKEQFLDSLGKGSTKETYLEPPKELNQGESQNKFID